MKRGLTAVAVLLTGVAALAQVGTTTPAPPAVTATAPSSVVPAVDPLLQELTQAGQAAAADLARLQIDRWKADSSSKQQAQHDADSLQRNLREALPGLIQAAQSAPADVGPKFKLYRNLNALYDVMASLTESAGAFGKKEDYDALAADTRRLDALRRQLADRLEAMTAQRDAEVARLRAAQQQAAAAAAAQPVKKIVIDGDQPAAKKKSPRKARIEKKAETAPK